MSRKLTGKAVEILKEHLYDASYTQLYYWCEYEKSGQHGMFRLWQDAIDRKSELCTILAECGYSGVETAEIEERARAEYWKDNK